MSQANPFDAMGQSFNALQGAWDQRTRNQAGNVYAKGGANKAADVLAQGGLISEADTLRGREQTRQIQLSQEERARAEQNLTFMQQGLRALSGVPYEQRDAVFEQMAPQLEALIGPEVTQQLRQADKSDQALAMFGQAIGAEADRLQLFQTRGGDIVSVNPRTGANSVVYDAPEAPREATAGMRWSADGSRLELIPGYAEGQAAISGSRRAPPRPRASGGRSGGSSASRPAAAPSRPWERFRR